VIAPVRITGVKIYVQRIDFADCRSDDLQTPLEAGLNPQEIYEWLQRPRLLDTLPVNDYFVDSLVRLENWYVGHASEDELAGETGSDVFSRWLL